MKVFVSGCFDMLHSGHVEFFRQAAIYGELVVAIGSDATIHGLKGQPTIYSESERLFMINAIKYVSHAFISSGSGILDFEAEFNQIKPDAFIVNHDGDSEAKRQLCMKAGVQYIVLDRIPAYGMPERSTTWQREHIFIPYRIEIAGGWLDQPWISGVYPGPVICAAIKPRSDFYDRSGLATSTRNKATKIWGLSIPPGNAEERARMLFCYDNPPGTANISGAQDAIGLAMPGLKRMDYDGDYWPTHIESVVDRDILDWLQENLYLLPLGPRPLDLDVLDNMVVREELVQDLARETRNVWQSIMNKDAKMFGHHITQTFIAQVEMFPAMVNHLVTAGIESLDNIDGYAVSGAGGGGYLIVVTDSPTPEMIEIEII